MLAVCDSFIVQWVVCATAAMVHDVWWVCAYVRDEMRMCMCKRGCVVAAVAIAVDRKIADASHGLKWPEELRPTYVCRMCGPGPRML